jgi:hypothetical protein
MGRTRLGGATRAYNEEGIDGTVHATAMERVKTVIAQGVVVRDDG